MSRVAGELVAETLDHDGGRDVTAYVPPGSPEAIVFAGDGQSISSRGPSLRQPTSHAPRAAVRCESHSRE